MKKSTKSILIALLATVLIGFCALLAYNYQNKTSFKYAKQAADEIKISQNEQDPVNAKIIEEAKKLKETRFQSNLTKILADDFILGDKNAKVLVIEYASLSCPHCASFALEGFEKLKKEFIDSGKVKFVFRHFPLNQPALMASMLVNCSANAAENRDEKFYETLKILFKTQDNWAFTQEFREKLANIALLDLITKEEFDKCVDSEKLQEKILKQRMAAANELQLRSTPTFFVNGEISEGYVDYVTLKKLIEKKINE
jgi:protein-disulfide isomerase